MKKSRRALILLIGVSLLFSCEKRDSEFRYFALSDVELLESPFQHAQELNKAYLLALDPDRLLAPYLREAGLPPKAESYTNWENTGLDGHIGGHYLSALSLMYASTADARIGERLEYLLSELKRVQEANGNGYIGGVPESRELWDEIAAGKIDAGGFSLNGRWVPLYNIHKMYAGLRDAWLHTGHPEAREMLLGMADWMIGVTSSLSDDQMQEMLRSEHGGLNETFADVAAITDDPKYLDLALRFSHRAILEPLLAGEDRLTGLHANTQIPKVLGYKRIADLTGNESWSESARFFWETVTHHRSVCIGGNSVHEHFNPVDDFSRMTSSEQGPETCNTYNMLRLTRMLHASSPNAAYADFYERALYNHILSTQHPGNGGLVYFTPLRPAHYRVYSQPQTSMWCCVGSGIENHSRYGEMIYARQGKQLYVNLFIPSRLQWKEQGVEIIQTNRFPEEPYTKLVVNPEKTLHFALKIRRPAWAENAALLLNGQPQPATVGEDGYMVLERRWRPGDEVVVELPMQLQVALLPDSSDFRSFTYGPVVLASRWGEEGLSGLFADDSRGGHIAHGAKVPPDEIPIVDAEEAALLAGITPLPDQPLHFSLSTSAGEVELEPFYAIHEARYILYWPTSESNPTSEGVAEATLDAVTCGQQQPESDHFVTYEDSETGYDKKRHWRSARGYFAYTLNDPGKRGRFLWLSFLNAQPGASSVSVNGQLVKTVTSAAGEGEELSVLIPLPAEIATGQLQVTLSGRNGLPTPKFTEVRLLSRSVEIE